MSQTESAPPAPSSAHPQGCFTMFAAPGLICLACILLAAHHLRGGEFGLIMLWLSAPLLLLIRRRWSAIILAGLLCYGGSVWLLTAFGIRSERLALGKPWVRMAIIMGAVAAFTFGTAFLFQVKSFGSKYLHDAAPWKEPIFAFALAFSLLAVIQLKAGITQVDGGMAPAILLERFVRGGGWFESFWLSVYAAWVAGGMADPRTSPVWRSRAWGFFSVVFFTQLALGLSGIDRLLMTGQLHIPVPALIVAGPIYRGGGLFMLVLFLSTLVMVGPAWCSHLCYIGAWDNLACKGKPQPEAMPKHREKIRAGILLAVIATATALHFSGLPAWFAAALALAFGLGGVGVMVFWSRKKGVMTHCTSYCPMGFVACLLGKVNPFRVKIGDGCVECGSCARACRYDALDMDKIRAKEVGFSCTLCGDCVGKCEAKAIGYRFLWLSAGAARSVFIVIIVALHAVFLGVARI